MAVSARQVQPRPASSVELTATLSAVPDIAAISRYHFNSMYTSAGLRYLPNLLTVARILVTPVLLLLLTVPNQAAQAGAVSLFVLASLSDYYDGVLARRLGVRSRLGQYLDPLADKVLILGTFAVLSVQVPAIVPWWAVVLIAGRDLVVTGLRSWAEAHGQTLRTYRVAKGKTLLQLAFLFAVLVLRSTARLSTPLGDWATWVLQESVLPGLALAVVVGFTLATGGLYLVAPVREQIPSG